MPVGRAAATAQRQQDASAVLEVEGLTITAGGRTLVRDLSFALPPGGLLCILGENGAGKTLTLHALAGLRAPAAGRVRLLGRGLGAWARRERARRLGLLTQATEDPFPVTVLDAVLVGRHPHLEFFARETGADVAAARAALAACDLVGFDYRTVDTLSGGERRRVAIAAVLTQDPALMLLDEPQNHLDPHHQRDVLELLRARASRASGCGVIATLHDPTLAAQYADAVLLLYGDGRWRHGPPEGVLTAATLSELYRMPMVAFESDGRRVFYAR